MELKLTADGFTPRPPSISLTGTCPGTNQNISTVTAVSGHLVENCYPGNIDTTIRWVKGCTTVYNWRERVATVNQGFVWGNSPLAPTSQVIPISTSKCGNQVSSLHTVCNECWYNIKNLWCHPISSTPISSNPICLTKSANVPFCLYSYIFLLTFVRGGLEGVEGWSSSIS